MELVAVGVDQLDHAVKTAGMTAQGECGRLRIVVYALIPGSFLAELVASIGRTIPISTSKSRRAPLAAGHRPPARPRGHGRRAGRIGFVAVWKAKGVRPLGADDIALRSNR